MTINITQIKSQWTINNEHGSALIISILLLAVMSVLGIVVMSTSTTEIQLSGNYRNSQESFYAADRTIEYAMQSASDSSDIVDLYNDQNNSIMGNPLHRDLITNGQSSLEPSNVNALDDRNSVTYIGNTAPPVGSGYEVSMTARNYVVDTVGVFPANADNPSRSELRTHYMKITP